MPKKVEKSLEKLAERKYQIITSQKAKKLSTGILIGLLNNKKD